MRNENKPNQGKNEDPIEGNSARQAFFRVVTLTLIAIVAAALILLAVLLIITR